MEFGDIARQRMANQRILSADGNPESILSYMGTMQAQDYPASLWAIGLRCKEYTAKEIEKAAEKREIVRTWLMRGTLHFAAAKDIRWMLGLFAPRLISTAKARDRNLGLSDRTIEKAKTLFAKALKGGNRLTREDMYGVLANGGISIEKNLGYHMLYRAAWDGLICFGPHDGKQPTFALLDEWIRNDKRLSNEEAVGELALRYFTSHGPATIKDYVWWSGLRVADAKAGMERSSGKLAEEEIDGKTYFMRKRMQRAEDDDTVHLLPAFDEYLVSYSDRSAMLGNDDTQKMLKSGNIFFTHSNGIFLPVVVVNGEVLGTWKRKNDKDRIIVSINQFKKLSRDHMEGVREAAERYGQFMEREIILK